MEVVGDGPVLKSLKNLAIKLKLKNQIVFHGLIAREKLANYYNRCDVFATGSAMEVQPLTLLEAMSCGLPIVGVKRAGVAGMVLNDINGYLVDPSSPQAMSKKIVKILSNNKLRLELSKNSRKTARENSLISSIQKLEDLYKKTV
jgi:glycosyltransferase involved in cell wall biosynthesis